MRYTKNKEEKRQRFQLIPNFVRLNNDRKKMVEKYDYLVIGSGIAGMSFALKVANEGRSVALICKAGQEEANTYFAQGGIASVTNLKVDNFEKHIEDTMIAGDWISDRAAVEKVVREAPAQIKALIDRSVSVWTVMKDKVFYFIMTSAEDTDTVMDCTLECFRGFISCIGGSTEGGVIYAKGVHSRGEVEGTEYMQQAYDMGRSI